MATGGSAAACVRVPVGINRAGKGVDKLYGSLAKCQHRPPGRAAADRDEVRAEAGVRADAGGKPQGLSTNSTGDGRVITGVHAGINRNHCTVGIDGCGRPNIIVSTLSIGLLNDA